MEPLYSSSSTCSVQIGLLNPRLDGRVLGVFLLVVGGDARCEDNAVLGEVNGVVVLDPAVSVGSRAARGDVKADEDDDSRPRKRSPDSASLCRGRDDDDDGTEPKLAL